MPDAKPRMSRLRKFGLIVTVIFLGIPAAVVFTQGYILIPFMVPIVLAPFIVVNYLLWGWWLSPKAEKRGSDRDEIIHQEHPPT